ncbi:hypothetical protein M8J77_024259 [Diaphorina citri]|nr:hypothetical protein M8J77_024259 [Diaphorina citri]
MRHKSLLHPVTMSTDDELPKLEPAGEVLHVAVTIPRFYKPDPEIYFLNVESQFLLAKITSDATKFAHLTAKLEPEILAEVSDILKDPNTRTYKVQSRQRCHHQEI